MDATSFYVVGPEAVIDGAGSFRVVVRSSTTKETRDFMCLLFLCWVLFAKNVVLSILLSFR